MVAWTANITRREKASQTLGKKFKVGRPGMSRRGAKCGRNEHWGESLVNRRQSFGYSKRKCVRLAGWVEACIASWARHRGLLWWETKCSFLVRHVYRRESWAVSNLRRFSSTFVPPPIFARFPCRRSNSLEANSKKSHARPPGTIFKRAS